MTRPTAAPVIDVRAATPTDWPEIGALTIEAYSREAPVGPGYLRSMGETAERAADPGVELLVATDPEGTIVGSVTATRAGSAWADVVGPGEGGFRMLAVRTGARGRGVGEALVRRCLEDARTERLDRVAILTQPAMVTAARLYARQGFRRLPWRDRVAPDGTELLALVVDLAPITVREATPDELPRAGELTLAGYLADGLVDPTASYASHLADARDRASAATLLVAIDEARTVVGTVTFCRPGSPYAEISNPGEAEFRMLAVDPAARGTGAGAALVHACLDRAGGAGPIEPWCCPRWRRCARRPGSTSVWVSRPIRVATGLLNPVWISSRTDGTCSQPTRAEGQSMTASTSPVWTTSPTATRTAVTRPPCSVRTGISIFIDSSRTTVSPGATASPGATTTSSTAATISASTTSATSPLSRPRVSHGSRARSNHAGAWP